MPERPIIIGFKGPRASGKTAAINCLLGEHILPCGSTSVPMVVKYNGSGDGTYKCRVRYMSKEVAGKDYHKLRDDTKTRIKYCRVRVFTDQ